MLLKLLASAFRRSGAALDDLEAQAAQHYERGELEAAERCFETLARRLPSDVKAWSNYAALLMKRQHYTAALPAIQRLIELAPGLAEAHLDLGTCRHRLGDDDPAVAAFQHAIALKPALQAAHANLLDAYLGACDWARVGEWRRAFLERRKGRPPSQWAWSVHPLSALMVLPTEITKEVAIERARDASEGARAAAAGRAHAPARSGGRIRIGYFSSDFNDHAAAHLTFGLYEAHDRDRFEIFCYSTGKDDGSAFREHIRATCDRFLDVQHWKAERIREAIEADAIDILVDLNGYTTGSRRDVLALRPAPVQVNYLGYPGTSGAEYIDYYVTDPVATPPGLEHEFTEQLVYLPDTYQPNHRCAIVSDEPFSRAALGLPEDAFVFCCFNAVRKIDADVFDVWMEILRAVPGSVLWLVKPSAAAQANLRREAAARNVDPARIVFAAPMPLPKHLARQRHADLFLDTFVYNAHTGGSQALWAGLPVLTLPGTAFAGRVGASLLHACDMAELAVKSRAEYVASAVRLAREPAALAALKARVNEKRQTAPLFDIRRYARHLEAAFETMHALRAKGRAPQGFAVGAIARGT